MSDEMATTHMRIAIEALLHAYALANMSRGSDNDTFRAKLRSTALGHFDGIEEQLRRARRDLQR